MNTMKQEKDQVLMRYVYRTKLFSEETDECAYKNIMKVEMIVSDA